MLRPRTFPSLAVKPPRKPAKMGVGLRRPPGQDARFHARVRATHRAEPLITRSAVSDSKATRPLEATIGGRIGQMAHARRDSGLGVRRQSWLFHRLVAWHVSYSKSLRHDTLKLAKTAQLRFLKRQLSLPVSMMSQ